MNRILFLVSGNGGLLKFVFLCIEKQILPNYLISMVIADRECNAFDFAVKKGLNSRIVTYDSNCRTQLLYEMKSNEFDVAITTIYKLLDPDIVNSFDKKLINVHPSLLPAFPGGLNAGKVALKAGVKFLGTTVHYVDEGVDTGEIIAQSIMPIKENSDEIVVFNHHYQSWCLNLLNVLLLRVNCSAVSASNAYMDTLFNPPLSFDTAVFDDEFWSEIRNG